MTWKDLCLDKRFQDLPFKIELNGRGQIIMSPTRNVHGYFANRIARLLEEFLPDGEVMVECAVETSDGTKETDVAWLSARTFDRVKDEFSCSVAPEICVEVTKELYFAAGASEYWLCNEQGELRFFAPSDELGTSRMCPGCPDRIRRR